jgi:1-acyl-sn-glycerol-3-phosphate acyltransferase
MTRFKKGAFTMAIASGLPVLPVSIHGSYEAWPPAQPWLHGGTIEVIIDPPIETSAMTHRDSSDLRDRVHDLVANRVTDMGGEVRAG